VKPLVKVEWLDAWADFDDACPDENLKAATCYAVGYLVRRDKTGITLASDGGPDEKGKWSYRFRHFIPAGMVKKVTKL